MNNDHHVIPCPPDKVYAQSITTSGTTPNETCIHNDNYVTSKTGVRPINVKSLRPGHLLEHYLYGRGFVVQNSNALGLTEIMFKSAVGTVFRNNRLFVFSHKEVGGDFLYIGKGAARRWHKYFPAFIAKYVLPYSY